MEDQNQITYFAETDFRNKKTPFGIKTSDRLRHMYIIGKTGMGKSTLLENMAAQDLKNGNGMCFIDPHGSAVDTLLNYVPENRIDDVVYFSPADTDFPISFNVMEDVGPEKRHLVAQGLLSAFKKIWGAETFSDRMEHIVNNTLLALLEYPDSTMLSIPRIFVDTDFQKDVIKHITDPSVLNFWSKEYASWDDRYKRDAYAAVLNKVGQFTSNPVIRNIIGQPKSTFDFRKIMDEKKILLINLSIGQIGESNANLLGSMMSTKVFLAAMSRADLSKPELSKLPEFYLHIDEFQNLANDSFADILSQARKYKLALTMAHQYVEQMPETVRSAVFGNVGTMIVMRVGSFDAEIFEKEFSPTFYSDDLVNLGFAQIYLRLMIDGVGSQPFSARTLPPIKEQEVSFKEEILEASRRHFGRSKEDVEREINEWNDKSFKVSKERKPTVGADGKPLKKADSVDIKKVQSPRVATVKTFQGTPQKPTPVAEQKPQQNKTESPQKAPAPVTSQSQENPPQKNQQRVGANYIDNRAKKTEINYRDDIVKKPNIEKPPLEGNVSLKEALAGALKTSESVKKFDVQDKKEIKKTQNNINKEIETENRNKLKEVLGGALREREEEIKKTEEIKDNEVKEVPEKVLKDLLS
ncbi:DUF87 domain-containing protein [Patescibacteria group bacterium]|nr:DUF87 domain-containing protein [Patescibacteria group bacterium]